MFTKIKIKAIRKLIVEIPRKELKNFKKGDEVQVEIRKIETCTVPYCGDDSSVVLPSDGTANFTTSTVPEQTTVNP